MPGHFYWTESGARKENRAFISWAKDNASLIGNMPILRDALDWRPPMPTIRPTYATPQNEHAAYLAEVITNHGTLTAIMIPGGLGENALVLLGAPAGVDYAGRPLRIISVRALGCIRPGNGGGSSGTGRWESAGRSGGSYFVPNVTRSTGTTRPLLGHNPRSGNGRTNTDLPGGRAAAKSIFSNLTRGQPISQQPLGNGGVRRTAPDGTQIRLNADGTTRIDLPGRGPQGRETIHFD